MSSEVEQHTSQRLLVRRLVLVAVLMFGFGFLLAPLYDVFCRVTGLNGKITNIGAPSQIVAVDAGRQVRVQFLAINNEGMPWRFQPEQAQ
ncbi:MAG TPA: cytochrome c oxidase assembly protein, partial [Motiliproteus sp.]